MSSAPLRRSRRGQKQEHGPGDRVEVVRDEGVAIGRLVRLVVDEDHQGEDAVARWIVSFEGETEEQEITEKYIGRLVESSETEASADSPSKASPRKTNKKRQSSLSPSRNDGQRPSTRSDTKSPLLKGIKVPSKKRSASTGEHEHESVVKVKMLTGTLYLYRGMHPRAEFIRTV